MLFLLLPLAMGFTAAETGIHAPEARTRYVSYFAGRYAEEGACSDPGALWMLGEKEISHGALTCVIHDVADHRGALAVRLGLCTERGEARPPRRYVLDLVSDDAVRATGDIGRVLLKRCP